MTGISVWNGGIFQNFCAKKRLTIRPVGAMLLETDKYEEEDEYIYFLNAESRWVMRSG